MSNVPVSKWMRSRTPCLVFVNPVERDGLGRLLAYLSHYGELYSIYVSGFCLHVMDLEPHYLEQSRDGFGNRIPSSRFSKLAGLRLCQTRQRSGVYLDSFEVFKCAQPAS
jgi:hypothetical protein